MSDHHPYAFMVRMPDQIVVDTDNAIVTNANVTRVRKTFSRGSALAPAVYFLEFAEIEVIGVHYSNIPLCDSQGELLDLSFPYPPGYVTKRV